MNLLIRNIINVGVLYSYIEKIPSTGYYYDIDSSVAKSTRGLFYTSANLMLLKSSFMIICVQGAQYLYENKIVANSTIITYTKGKNQRRQFEIRVPSSAKRISMQRCGNTKM